MFWSQDTAAGQPVKLNHRVHSSPRRRRYPSFASRARPSAPLSPGLQRMPPSPHGRGRGRGVGGEGAARADLGSTTRTRLVDRLRDDLKLVVDLCVPETQHLPARALQSARTTVIRRSSPEMRCAVHLDNDLARDTGEIDDVAADRMLSAKLEPSQHAIAQHAPQTRLGRHVTTPQNACAFDGFLLPGHGLPPHPPPLSPGRDDTARVTVVVGRGRGERTRPTQRCCSRAIHLDSSTSRGGAGRRRPSPRPATNACLAARAWPGERGRG